MEHLKCPKTDGISLPRMWREVDLKLGYCLKVNLQTARTQIPSLGACLSLERLKWRRVSVLENAKHNRRQGHLTPNWEIRSNIPIECLDLTSSSTQIPECYRHNLNPLVRRLESAQTERKALKMLLGEATPPVKQPLSAYSRISQAGHY